MEETIRYLYTLLAAEAIKASKESKADYKYKNSCQNILDIIASCVKVQDASYAK